MKKHKIIVTRDTDGCCSIWRKTAKLKKYDTGTWDIPRKSSVPRPDLICDELDPANNVNIRRLFGFTPRKGSKQTITITRE